MTCEGIKLPKNHIASISDLFDILESKNVVNLSSDLRASNLYTDDITNFIMYLIASDRSINVEEVEVYRRLTGYEDTMDTIKHNIEEGTVLSCEFQSNIPMSLRLLVNATNRLTPHDLDVDIAHILEGYIATFVFVGREIMCADNCVTFQERRDFELYIKNMILYIDEHSCARFKKPLTNLLEN